METASPGTRLAMLRDLPPPLPLEGGITALLHQEEETMALQVSAHGEVVEVVEEEAAASAAAVEARSQANRDLRDQ